MKRIGMVFGLVSALAVSALGGAILLAVPASAATAAACTDWNDHYKIKSAVAQRTPTSVYSNWVWPKNGQFQITYNETKSYTNNVSTTATVTASANFVFGSASASIGVTVGRSWTESKAWSYSATVAKDASHEYRVHLYHQSYNFSVMKVSSRVCNGVTQNVNEWSSWQSVHHAPVRGASANVWEIDKRSA